MNLDITIDRTIYENILSNTRKMPPDTPIADVRTSAEAGLGEIFVVEGYVTAGTANENTKFFDAIYLQDETAGITVFPYSELGLELGTKMRITGYTDAYQGDIEIQIMRYEILDEEKKIIDPEQLAARDAMDYGRNGGKLIQVQGEVVGVTMSNGVVSEFVVRDDQGDEAKVFIDGYILSGTTGKNELTDIVREGNTVSAVGLLYLHPEGDSEVSVAVLRVRDCDEIKLIEEASEITNPFVDIVPGAYYEDAVLWAAENGVTKGVDETHFAPDATCIRAQTVTFLWRAAGSPEPASMNNPFTDLEEGSYYYKAVLWAAEQGITKGTSETTFSPYGECTRAQAVTFLWRVMDAPAASNGTNPFKDVAQGAFYYDAVVWAVEAEVTEGMTSDTFAPNLVCTRGQIVTFLYRVLG